MLFHEKRSQLAPSKAVIMASFPPEKFSKNFQSRKGGYSGACTFLLFHGKRSQLAPSEAVVKASFFNPKNFSKIFQSRKEGFGGDQITKSGPFYQKIWLNVPYY